MKYIATGLVNWYAKYHEVDRMLMVSCSFSLALVFCRLVYTSQTLFLFLVWNLFLAVIPYLLSGYIARFRSRIYLLSGIICWLIFLPNSFYILTDLFHLTERPEAPLWFDLALILSFAWNGLLLGILSIRQIEKVFVSYFNPRLEILFITLLMFLNGLGIYIGRYLRFNSWDVLTNPFQLASDILYLFIHPLRNRFDWSMVICFSVLLTLIYFAFKKTARHFHQ